MPTPIIDGQPEFGTEEQARKVSYSELRAFRTAYTTPAGKHLSMQMLALSDGWRRRVYRDNSEDSPIKGRVMAFENHHPTNQNLHENFLMPVE